MYVGRSVESREIRGVPRAAFSNVRQSGKGYDVCRCFGRHKLEQSDSKTGGGSRNQFAFKSKPALTEQRLGR